MDLTVIDVTQVPAQHLALGAPVELIGDHCPIDDVAAAGDTIAYEMLTSLGRRYDRVYVGD
jgi:alanine racemase